MSIKKLVIGSVYSNELLFSITLHITGNSLTPIQSHDRPPYFVEQDCIGVHGMRLLNAVAAALVVLGAQQAGAAGLCKIKALRDVPAVGGDFVLKKGTVIDEVTQYRVDRFTGDASVCNHGGYCYPTKADADGKHLESFDLINCAIDKTKPYAPANESTIYYGFVVIRAQVDPVELRRDDVDNKLLQMGLCNACAYGAADTYVKSPHSACGELIQSALEGSQEAIGKLQDEYQRYCP